MIEAGSEDADTDLARIENVARDRLRAPEASPFAGDQVKPFAGLDGVKTVEGDARQSLRRGVQDFAQPAPVYRGQGRGCSKEPVGRRRGDNQQIPGSPDKRLKGAGGIAQDGRRLAIGLPEDNDVSPPGALAQVRGDLLASGVVRPGPTGSLDEFADRQSSARSFLNPWRRRPHDAAPTPLGRLQCSQASSARGTNHPLGQLGFGVVRPRKEDKASHLSDSHYGSEENDPLGVVVEDSVADLKPAMGCEWPGPDPEYPGRVLPREAQGTQKDRGPKKTGSLARRPRQNALEAGDDRRDPGRVRGHVGRRGKALDQRVDGRRGTMTPSIHKGASEGDDLGQMKRSRRRRRKGSRGQGRRGPPGSIQCGGCQAGLCESLKPGLRSGHTIPEHLQRPCDVRQAAVDVPEAVEDKDVRADR